LESRRSAEIIVESLSLCNTNITREGFASAVSRYLNEPQLLKIRKIDFSNNKLTYHSANVLANQLRRVCRLVHLTLENNTLGDNGVGKVLDAIVESGGAPGLIRLELRNNNITLGTKALAKLPNFKNIKALDLGNNCITVDTKHQKHLFTSIFQSLTNLVFLSLCNNKIKDDGFNILMNEIMPRDNVQRLNLSNCFITSKSIKLIQAIVSKECSNRKYEFLILQGHLINSELLPELRYMINNYSLNIHFDGNQASSIEYPLLYDDDILNAMNDNHDMKGEHSDKQGHCNTNTQLSEFYPNNKKQSPKDYYDNEELQQKLLKEKKALNTMKEVNKFH
jgi:Ran GTPase-activating protein (RanGAP) involved in mRNA processing and transport